MGPGETDEMLPCQWVIPVKKTSDVAKEDKQKVEAMFAAHCQEMIVATLRDNITKVQT